MPFYGRKTELKKLRRMFQSKEQLVGLIYGRRRIGKSELIKQALKTNDSPFIYYECKQTTEYNNVESISQLIGDLYHFPKPSFSNIEALLDFLFQKSCNQSLILVLDEYPYLRETVTGLDSILQSLIDKYKDSSYLKLIICGSYIDIMRSLLETQNPLYGRVDITIQLKPMDYYESSLFYSSFSNSDKVRLYSTFGGIPYYNRLIDPNFSVQENIIEMIASDGARLENEIEMYLKSEISKINNANEVFEALAHGYSKYKDILSQSHVSSSPALTDVLKKLMRMELVAKEAPINDEKNRKKAKYYIIDNLSSFYFRYIFPYSSQMQVMNPETFYQYYIEKDFESQFVPHVFEDICKQYLIRCNQKGKLNPPFEKIGKYYYDDPKTHTNGEFDIVTKDKNGYIFYEAKFKKGKIKQSTIEKEIQQVNATGLHCYKYGFISQSGFESEPKTNIIFIDLDDLYNQNL